MKLMINLILTHNWHWISYEDSVLGFMKYLYMYDLRAIGDHCSIVETTRRTEPMCIVVFDMNNNCSNKGT